MISLVHIALLFCSMVFFVPTTVAAVGVRSLNMCGMDCGPHGVCLPNRKYNCTTETNCPFNCQCRPPYTGDNCTTIVVSCPEADEPSDTDATECYNGGKCEEYDDENGRIGIRCNCQSAAGDSSVFTGKQCEYPAKVVCEQDRPFSSYAFCVNGGTCKKTVDPGHPHAGCDCPSGFVGRHCQFREGDPNPDEVHYVNTNKISSTKSDASRTGIIVLIFLLVLFSMLAIGCFYVRRRRKSTTSSGKEDPAAGETTEQEMEDTSDNIPEEEEHAVVI